MRRVIGVGAGGAKHDGVASRDVLLFDVEAEDVAGAGEVVANGSDGATCSRSELGVGHGLTAEQRIAEAAMDGR